MARFPYVVLALGVFAVSVAAILIRLAQAEGMPSLAIAAYRLLFAALLLTPFVALRAIPRLSQLGRVQIWQIGAAGLFLALHFATWVSSLDYTSVASSVALVTSHPLWVALAAFVFFRIRPGPYAMAGIALTLAGTAIIFASDQRAGIGSNPLLGNGLAVAGALSVTGYILCARAMRAAIGTWIYVWLVYGVAALVLTVGALSFGSLRTGLTSYTLLLVIALAIGPQLIGHTAINWSARKLQPTMVSVAILGEPVIGAALAWSLLGERVAAMQLIGFGATLCGIVLCALDRGTRAATGMSG
jgi:drug/metabolite transporter (DMT)-like permease